jgi:thiamine-phosphate pyrophosphorylase
LRKPGREKKSLDAYLKEMPAALHGRIMVHGHPELLEKFALKGIHFPERQRRESPEKIRGVRQVRPKTSISSSFHRIVDIPANDGLFDYIFISPVFDSISKAGYRSAFEHEELKRFLAATDQRIVALGGIDGRKISTAADLGFYGVAVLGAIWSSANPVKTVLALADACRSRKS